MIEDFETENTDYFSLAGRAALVGGAAFGLNKTFNDLRSNRPVNPTNSSFRSNVGRIAGIQSAATPNYDIEATRDFSDILGDTREVRRSRRIKFNQGMPSALEGMGFRTQGQLVPELRQFKTTLLNEGFTGITMQNKMLGGEVGQVRIRGRYGGRMFTFDVNPIGTQGGMFIGDNLQNKYSVRGILDPASLSNRITQSNLNVIDADVALVRQYQTRIKDIVSGKLNPRDLYRQIQDAAIYEDSGLGGAQISSATGVLRRDQIVTDPFKELSGEGRAQLMKQLTQIPGYTAGGPGQFAKGILTSPGSLLSQIPGGGIAPSAYQYVRESAFDQSLTPKLKMAGDMAGVGEFKYAFADKDLLQKALAHIDPHIGEIADEELVMNRTRDFMVKNQIYNAKIDLDQKATAQSERMLEKIRKSLGLEDMKHLGEILASPGGIASMGPEALQKINFDINAEYADLKEKTRRTEEYLDRVTRDVKMSGEAKRTARSQIIEELKGYRKRMQDFEVFSVSEDMSTASKLPSKELQNRIVNMTVDSNNNLSVALESHYRFGVGGKSFGALKSTVKAELDTAEVLAQMEHYKVFGKFGTKQDLIDQGLIKSFEDVDFIGVESPVKTIGGTGLEARRLPSAITGYVSTAIDRGDFEHLAQLGVTESGGRYTLPDVGERDMINRIMDLNKGKTMDEVFGGRVMGEAGTRISNVLLSADIHSMQSGMGNKASITERGLYYLESLGLGGVTEDIYSRTLRGTDTFGQIQVFEEAMQLAADNTTKGTTINQLFKAGMLTMEEGKMGDLFSQNLGERSRDIDILTGMLGKKDMVVDLGKRVEDITGIRKAVVFGDEMMAPYVGAQIGAEQSVTALDRATNEFLLAAADTAPGSEERIAATAQRYKQELDTVKGSLTDSIGKAKVKGSMYGQAVSSLEGMNNAGKQLGKAMGLGDEVIAPVVAMTARDIRSRFGKKALEQARLNELFGIVTREPIEGVHSVMPAQIVLAERMVSGKRLSDSLGDMEGRVFLAESDIMRKGLMIDFDKDAVSVIAAKTDQATDQIKKFMGLDPANPSAAGSAYYDSLMRMSTFELKGKTPVDALKKADMELAELLAAQKDLEKGKIGVFSNEFKNVHIGLREQMAQAGDRVNYKQYFLGEDFSHLFVENIIKAKHQSEAALMKNEAMETLDILNARNKYRSATMDTRATRLQEIFDQLVFTSPDTGAQVRAAAESVDILGTLRENKALAMELGVAEEVADGLKFTQSQKHIERKIAAFAEVSSQDNLRNVLNAASTGRKISRQGDYAYESVKAYMKPPTNLQTFADDAVNFTRRVMDSGIKNIGKYAVAPTAIIGFASSLISEPNILKPTTQGSKDHAKTNAEPPSVEMPKTIFAIPETRVDNINIRGKATRNSNPEDLIRMVNQRGGSSHVNYSDFRSKPDKYRLEELIEKGY